MEGAVIGNYQVVRKLGEGGMGAVYLGHHTLLGRRAAIKVLLPMLSARPDIVNRFFNEARATTSISDPGIVQIFDFGYHTDGSAFIVMEYLDGEPLDARLAKLGRLPVYDALRLCRQVATSLAAAHAQRIVHRDLKPENIYLVRDPEMANGERAKILDFGIAKLSDDHPGKLKTSTGALMGTPIYMSPEQCHGASELDHRSDIYALGCVLFHLIVGTPPFDGEGMGEIIAAHLREEPPAPSSRCDGVAPAVDALVLRCLAKAPADRYQTMTELSRAMGQLVGHITSPESATVFAPDRRPTPPPPMPGTPVPGTPVPGTPVPGTPVPAAPLTQLANPTTLGSGAGEASAPPRAPRRLGVVAAAVLIVAAAAAATVVVLHRDTAGGDGDPSSLAKPVAPSDDVAGRRGDNGASNPATGGSPVNQLGRGGMNQTTGGAAPNQPGDGTASTSGGGTLSNGNGVGTSTTGSSNQASGGGTASTSGGGTASTSGGTASNGSGAGTSSSAAGSSNQNGNGAAATGSSNQTNGNASGHARDGATTAAHDAASHVPPHHHAPPPARPHPAQPPAPAHPGSGSAASTPPGCDRSIDHDCDGIPDVR